jgi:hypothetical protein
MRTIILTWRLGGLAALLAAGVLTDTSDAHACGGCFHGPPPASQTVTVITDHRMVFSISPQQTVLWDQVEYSGAASDFAWVLPVKPGARIELSQDAWIASLDAATQTVIQAPVNNCGVVQTQDVGGGGGGGFGCGSSSSAGSAEFAGAGEADAGAAEDAGSPVTVVTQQVVGPYDSVTVRSSQGEALGDWLRANGYDVPQSLQPVIDAFTSEGFDFIALKLAPNEGVQAMQPVRVVTPGADLSLPLRMVAAGVGAHVGLELFVLSEGRYHPQNFPDATIDFSQLEWDPSMQISNYTTLAQQALAANGGRGWLTETAGPANLYGAGAGGNPSLSSAYLSTCTPQVLQPPPGCGSTEAGAPEASAEASTEAGVDEAGTDAGVDAAPPPATNDAGTGGGSACQPQTIACDDLDLAMTGITPGNLWITRLRADLPAAALSDDLVLEAAPSQDPVPSFHQTTAYTVANYDPCPANQGTSSGASQPAVGVCGCRTIDSVPLRRGDLVILTLAGLGGVLSVRRRRRRM